jgi:hypothetical protein
MCKQTHHHFLVGQEKQLSNGIVNNEYRINLVQFRNTIYRSRRTTLVIFDVGSMIA